MTLPDLISRLERAKGPSRALGNDVLLACGWRIDPEDHNRIGAASDIWVAPNRERYDSLSSRFPNPTSSLDAALTLVPEGFNKTISELANGHRRADIWKPDNIRTEFHHAGGASMAICICIAALRAREAKGKEGG